MKRAAPPVTTAVAVVVGLVLVLSACAGPEPSTTTEPDADGSLSGGEIIYGLSADPICVDPNQTDLTASRDVSRTFAASVLNADPETGEIVPWLATEWEVNEDATVFEFITRDGVTFSDGEEWNAESFKVFLDGIDELGGRAVNASTYIEGYEGTEILREDAVRVSFSRPNASFLQALSTVNMAVLSPRTYQEVSPEDRCLGELSGAGPFVLESFVPAQEVVVVKREDYDWPSPNAQHEGAAYLDKITFRVVAEASQRVGGLSASTLHAFNSVPSQDEESLLASGFQVLSTNNPGTVSQYLTNNSSPTLSDPAVRKAIQLGIDNEEYRDTLLLPRYNLATSVLSSTTPYYTDFSSYLYHDPEEAKRILDGAGWVPGADGIREKDGIRLSVNVVNGQSGAPTAHELRAQQLAEIGVELTITQVSRAEMLAALDTGDYDFVPYGFTRADPAALNMHFTTTRNNPLHLEPSELDDHLEQADAAADPQERQIAIDKAAEHIVANNLVIVFNEQSVAHAASPSLRDIRWEPGAQISFYDAYLTD